MFNAIEPIIKLNGIIYYISQNNSILLLFYFYELIAGERTEKYGRNQKKYDKTSLACILV